MNNATTDAALDVDAAAAVFRGAFARPAFAAVRPFLDAHISESPEAMAAAVARGYAPSLRADLMGARQAIAFAAVWDAAAVAGGFPSRAVVFNASAGA